MAYQPPWIIECCEDTGVHNFAKVQILDENDCISHSPSTLRKGMNPIILPPAMGK